MAALKHLIGLLIVIAFTGAGPFPVMGETLDSSSGDLRGTRTIRSLHQIRQSRTVRQRWDISCGSAALSTILTHHYADKISEAVVITSILRIADPVKIRDRGGFSLLDLKRFVESKGYEGKGYAGMTLEELTGLGVPAIVPIQARGYDHFVVFRGIRGNRVVLSDPAFGTVTMKSDRFSDIWKGGVGFIVLRRDSAGPSGGLDPQPEELLFPDGAGIGRASRIGATTFTRRGS